MRRKARRSRVGWELGEERMSLLPLWISLSVAILFVAAGCGSEKPSLPVPLKGKSASIDKKRAEATKVGEKKEAEKKEEPVYAYSPAGKPDPFKPFLQLTPVRDLKNVPLTPLEKYEIAQLKLVAIISGGEGNIALVEDSAGKGYFVKKGTAIGKNEGKVTRVLRDKVVIEEVYQDILGQRKTNEISLFLHRMEEGGGQ